MNSIDLRSANWKDVKEAGYDAVILPWGALNRTITICRTLRIVICRIT